MTILLQVIQTTGRPGRMTYVQSTDQVWVQQTSDDRSDHHQPHHHHRQHQLQQQNGDDSDADEVVVIRQAGEQLLHRVVHVDKQQNHANSIIRVRRQLFITLSFIYFIYCYTRIKQSVKNRK